ncbi:MAG: hypothetical protein ACTHLO_10145 [Pseudolabrys sp.]
MTKDELQTLLDSHGADPAQWPAALRVAALGLIAADAQARAAHEAAGKMDAALARYAKVSPADETAAARVLTRLAGPLPRQDRAWWRWPAVLLDWQFTPVWPRVAALACCAAIGFMVGITGLDRPFERTSTVASTGGDITSAVFEAEPITGARP